jgi:hypothetical protein
MNSMIPLLQIAVRVHLCKLHAMNFAILCGDAPVIPHCPRRLLIMSRVTSLCLASSAGQTERLKTAFYGEFNSSGAGANPKQREPYSHQLTGQVAAQFSPERYLAGSDGWNPKTVK